MLSGIVICFFTRKGRQTMLEEILGVNGVTNEGKFVHANLSMSNGTEGWSPWKEVSAAAGAQDPGPFSSVDSVDNGSGDMHICGITAAGRLLHTILNIEAAVWGAFDSPQTLMVDNPVKFLEESIDTRQFLQVRIDLTADGLHLCVLTRVLGLHVSQQHILHTVRHNNGTWDAFQDITQAALAGFPGSFVAVDCAAGTDSTQKLHVCGVTADGKLWHTALSNQNVWSQFAEVKTGFPKDTEHFTDIRIAGSGDKLHVCALRSGVLWHTVLFSNPVSWQPTFDNVNVEASNPGTILSFACVAQNDKLHVPVVTSDGKLWHTMLFEQLAGWVPFEDVTAIIGDLAILLSIISLITVTFALFGGTSCPSGMQLRISNDCNAIRRGIRPNAANARADLQSLKKQPKLSQCNFPC
jgi:hypothetical protein